MADSSCTREDRRERIVAECNAVRQALQVRACVVLSPIKIYFVVAQPAVVANKALLNTWPKCSVHFDA